MGDETAETSIPTIQEQLQPPPQTQSLSYLVPSHTPDDAFNTASYFPSLNIPSSPFTESQPSSWARNYAACYLHRSCLCQSQRGASEIISINSDLSKAHWIVGDLRELSILLPSISDSRKLVEFHLDYILWHHNSFHAPTFLQQCEKFWESGSYDHPS